jgi:rod shape-determining protein MreD
VTPEPSVLRRALAAVALVVALFATVVIQLTVVNRLPLPGATQPDLVLLLVTAIAVVTGPATGALTGFAGGLALDIAPPTAHYAGEYALIFCLAGYAAARVVRAIWNMTGERDPVIAFTVMAAVTAAGEAGKAALGMLLSDPDVTAAAVTRVLPAAILYDLLLSPLVYWLVAFVARGAVTWGPGTGLAPVPDFGRAGRLAPAFRHASAGAAPDLGLAGTGADYHRPPAARWAPKLRLAGTGADYHRPPAARRVPKLRLAGTGMDHHRPPAARPVPKLRLSDGRAGSSLRTTAAGTNGAPFRLAGGRAGKLNFGGDRPGRTAARTVRTPGKNWLRAAPAGRRAGSGLVAPGLAGSGLAGPGLAVRGVRAPRKNWLRSTSSPAAPAVKRTVRSPSRGWLRASGGARRAGGGAGLNGGRAGAGRVASSPSFPRSARSGAEVLAARSAPSGLSALSGPGTPLARRSRARTRSPQAGWLRSSGPAPSRAAAGRRLAPRRGWMGSARRPRTVVGSTVRRSGYTASPSGAWLRRSNRSWRKRRQWLLQLVGVSR